LDHGKGPIYLPRIVFRIYNYNIYFSKIDLRIKRRLVGLFHKKLPVVPHKAVAEVSKIGNL
jgi:hypothetical protein